jgi:hypothetical protein
MSNAEGSTQCRLTPMTDAAGARAALEEVLRWRDQLTALVGSADFAKLPTADQIRIESSPDRRRARVSRARRRGREDRHPCNRRRRSVVGSFGIGDIVDVLTGLGGR